MQRLHLRPSVMLWTDTFLLDKQIGLAFDGERVTLKPVSMGILQRSPISPILFLIFLRFLFTAIQNKNGPVWRGLVKLWPCYCSCRTPTRIETLQNPASSGQCPETPASSRQHPKPPDPR